MVIYAIVNERNYLWIAGFEDEPKKWSSNLVDSLSNCRMCTWKNSGDFNVLRNHDFCDAGAALLPTQLWAYQLSYFFSSSSKPALHNLFRSFIPFTKTHEHNKLTSSQLSDFSSVGKSNASALQKSWYWIPLKSPEFFRCIYDNCSNCLRGSFLQFIP